MANINIDYLDYEITGPDTADNSFSVSAKKGNSNEHTFVIEVTAGTVQFCVGQPVGANSPFHTVGAKLVMTNLNEGLVYYKCAAGTDSFIVGF